MKRPPNLTEAQKAFLEKVRPFVYVEPEIEYDNDCVCECGATYGEHYSDLRGDNWCPIDEDQTFSPFALLWPHNTFVN